MQVAMRAVFVDLIRAEIIYTPAEHVTSSAARTFGMQHRPSFGSELMIHG